jgi:hypothetical protein
LTTWLRLAADNDLWDEVEQTAEELRTEMATHLSVYVPLSTDALWVAHRAGMADTLRSLPAGQRAAPVWLDAGFAILDERYADAALALNRIGNVADEAYARLRAAEQLVAAGRSAEASAELDRALAFYRSVGATRYIREAEALLAASA